ncbi:alpha-2-macroglobulin family protein [Kaarinaea lacus]
MSAPRKTIPADGASGLDPVNSIVLTFDEPLDVDALANMVTIELRPLPGVGAVSPRWLDKDDFTVKISDRSRRSDPAVYALVLNQSIAAGQQVMVHLRLSLQDSIEQSFRQIRFATAEPFRIVRFGCAANRYPVTPEGVRYTKEQAIQCNSNNTVLEVEFSSPLAEFNAVQARNLVRLTPAVKDLQFSHYGKTLAIRGKFSADTLYQLNLLPSSIYDVQQRPLQQSGVSELFLYFPPKHPFLEWEASHGIVERYGPQMVPVKGRGHDRLDLRIYTVNPLDRSFWPFPQQPISIDESQRPPGPGEQAESFDNASRFISTGELIHQIRSLGSPAYSSIVAIPLQRSGASAKFGLSLKDYFAEIAGKQASGSYLVGIRRLDGSTTRSWIRLQVTDLSLTAVEERTAVKFTVTSLRSGKPMTKAKIRVEAVQDNQWITLTSGETDAQGHYYWQAPGYRYGEPYIAIRRLVVEKGNDVLVLDATRPPDQFGNNLWRTSRDTWLQWTVGTLAGRESTKEHLCHIFSDRPLYKPEDDVHIKAYLRNRYQSQFSVLSAKAQLVVSGPGNREWRYDVAVSSAGSIYHKFNEDKLPTGGYSAYLELEDIGRCGSLYFEKEAYRIPRFEVQLHGPDQVSLDKKFNVTMTARYYAGGQVAGQPIRWRVTQFPYTWTPKKREGFLYSSDARFSNREAFRSSPVISKESQTDDNGAAVLELDPAIEPAAQPRSYVIEATVTGADDQTVTNTKRVYALPAVVLGIKAPRYLEKADVITPEIIAVGPDGKLLSNQSITLRLLKRQWHSHLQAADFSQATAKYVTEVVDETVLEKTIQSQTKPLKVNLPIQSSGVYIIELETHDQLGRAQIINVDLYAGGGEPVTWSQAPAAVFSVTTDKTRYEPGDTAKLILQSPYQSARALVIVEAPDKNRYEWISVRGGSATFQLPVTTAFTPRVPVHFVLMRGRVGDTLPALNQIDLGKPATVAATHWVEVKPIEHIVDIKVDAPEKVLPGEQITVDIRLQDNHQKPLPGEVTLWLVDQAVLALAKEQRLDPLPDFITSPDSMVSVRDSRNLAFGHLPFEEQPGGGEAAASEAADLIDKVTVRKNFKVVPYYNPAIKVDKSGRATVKINMPDNLTNFKLRVKAVSGASRFGFAKGSIAVRLPVIVQPALPRFVRPGDRFTATAIGRVVEGQGGDGIATVKTDGLTLQAGAIQRFQWNVNKPQRLDFQVSVPSPRYNDKGELSNREVNFTCAVERQSDKARDAFQVSIPVHPDRKAVIQRDIKTLSAGEQLPLPAITEAVRDGTVKRSVLLSNQPGLIKMAAGLNYLFEYPHGCTEQRLSRARGFLAAKSFQPLIGNDYDQKDIDRSVQQTLQWIDSVVDGNGLAAYWPGSTGYVSLTAWVVQFLVEAREAGYPIDEKLLDRLTYSLQQALRSDYRHFITGENYTERTMALWALSVAGKVNASYAAELARKANYLNLESTALVMRVLSKDVGKSAEPTLAKLNKRLWEGLVFRLYRGDEIYSGLQKTALPLNHLVLPSESRTVSEVLLTLQPTFNDHRRVQTLVNGLTTLGQHDGWGSTNANASALLALSQFMNPRSQPADPEIQTNEQELVVQLDGQPRTVHLSIAQRMLRMLSTQQNEGFINYAAGDQPVVVRTETRYVPQADGSYIAPIAQGFVVNRELFKLLAEDQPMQRIALESAGQKIPLTVGEVIEDHVQIVNSVDRTFVAVVAPLAAGLEILNPRLATAPPEAEPKGRITLSPSYVAYLDHQVAFYYDTLPKGVYDFYFRTRATVPGSFTLPAAYAEMMYQQAINGGSAGARIEITPIKTSSSNP